MLIILHCSLEKHSISWSYNSFILTHYFCFSVTRRLKSIKNIQKITKSMKMVAAAKYARAERELKPARVYGTGSLGKRTVWLAFVSSHRGGGSEYLTRTHLHGALWGQGLVGPLKLSWLLSAPWKELRSAVCDTPCGLVPSAKPWRDAVGWGGAGGSDQATVVRSTVFKRQP